MLIREGLVERGRAKNEMPMRTFVVMALIICVLGVISGCHSGIMRGAGSDVERLGERMQR